MALSYKLPKDESQILAVEQPLDTNVLVSAGPGSGKTKTLLARIEYLAENNIPEDKIYCITFTKKVRDELRARGAVQAHTINSFVFQLLKKQHDVNHFMNYGADDYALQEELLVALLNDEKSVDLINYIQANIRSLLIDEVQDLSRPQFNVIKYISKLGVPVFGVGDRNQAIYHWRGSLKDAMGSWLEEIPSNHSWLQWNYRNPQRIINAAHNLIKHNGQVSAVTSKPNVASDTDGEIVLLIPSKDKAVNTYAFPYFGDMMDSVYRKISELPRNTSIALLCNFNKHVGLINADVRFKDCNVMTIHKAKGTEYDYVFLIGFMEGHIPNIKALTLPGNERILEQRCLAYVALTRTIKNFYFTVQAEPYGSRLSRFALEMEEYKVEQVK